MGKNIRKILIEADFGAIGIGAMIVFIAMVLVAGIAASVLVQTANDLEIQAMQTGRETTYEVSSGLSVEDIEGHCNTDINYLAITIRPRSGSHEIDLSEAFVEISDSSIKNVLKFSSNHFINKSEINGSLFNDSFYTGLTGQMFGVIVVEDADGSCTWSSPVINRGDKVMITILCGATGAFGQELAERTEVWGMVAPEEGSSGMFGFRTPASYQTTVYDLY